MLALTGEKAWTLCMVCNLRGQGSHAGHKLEQSCDDRCQLDLGYP